jgi:outer membrane protein, multidrug efflux system
MKRETLVWLAALLLGGCTVGPNYHKPQVTVPPAFRNATPPLQESSASLADLPWWEEFKDPVLQKLIRTGLERNYDARIAAEQIVAARAQVALARSNQLPQVTLNPSYTGGKTGTYVPNVNTNLETLTADLGYQLDLFGGLRRATEAARAALLATEEARRTVIVTLVSDIGSDYYQLLALDLQLQIAHETVVSQTKSVVLTKSRADAGESTNADWLQARQVLDSANAQIPALERQISRMEDAISILLGNYPEEVPRGAALTAQQMPPAVPAGLTSALLDHRPDIRKAEKILIEYNAEIGVARAQFFPQISLTGAVGRSLALTSLMNSQISIWTYAASLTQPIFEGGRLKANLHIAESEQRQALLTYMQTIQQAFGDVSDSLVDVEKYREIRLKEEEYVRDLDESVRLADMRYDGGITNYLEVLDAQRSLFAEQLTLAQFRGNEFQSLVQLYRALGGGWQQ